MQSRTRPKNTPVDGGEHILSLLEIAKAQQPKPVVSWSVDLFVRLPFLILSQVPRKSILKAAVNAADADGDDATQSIATTATTTSLANSWVGASAWPNMHAHGVRLFEVPDHNTNSTTTTSPPSHPLPPSQTLILPGPHMTRTRTRALRGLDDAALLAAQWPSARWTGVDGHGLRRYRLSPVRIFPSGLRR